MRPNRCIGDTEWRALRLEALDAINGLAAIVDAVAHVLNATMLTTIRQTTA